VLHILNFAYVWFARPKNVSNYSMIAFVPDVIYVLCCAWNISLFTAVILLAFTHFLNPFYDLSYVFSTLLFSVYVYWATTNVLN
jgi:hypothetical protein